MMKNPQNMESIIHPNFCENFPTSPNLLHSQVSFQSKVPWWVAFALVFWLEKNLFALVSLIRSIFYSRINWLFLPDRRPHRNSRSSWFTIRIRLEMDFSKQNSSGCNRFSQLLFKNISLTEVKTKLILRLLRIKDGLVYCCPNQQSMTVVVAAWHSQASTEKHHLRVGFTSSLNPHPRSTSNGPWIRQSQRPFGWSGHRRLIRAVRDFFGIRYNTSGTDWPNIRTLFME